MTAPAYDTERMGELILALLWANSFEEYGHFRAWKSLPWDALDRLHARALISAPRNRNKSVALDDAAAERGRAAFEQWFGSAPSPLERTRTKTDKPSTRAPPRLRPCTGSRSPWLASSRRSGAVWSY